MRYIPSWIPVVASLLLLQGALLGAAWLSGGSFDLWGAEPASAAFLTRAITSPVTLLEKSDLVVRGQITAVTGRWNQAGSEIESVVAVAVRYPIVGVAPRELTVLAPGGILPSGLELRISRQPAFAAGEEVILFLRQHSDGAYRVTGGEPGKYAVGQGYAVNAALLSQEPLGDLLEAIRTLAGAGRRLVTLPSMWAAAEPAETELPVHASAYVYKNRKWAGNEVPFHVNINSQSAGGANGSADEFRQAIIAAADVWSNVAGADWSLVYAGETAHTDVGYDQSNDIVFVDKGMEDENGDYQPLGVAQVWYIGSEIMEADIWVNDGYAWDATGDPDRDEPDLQSLAVHELGHWISLGHDGSSAAVMYAYLTLGTTKRVLSNTDIEGVEFVYPCTAGQYPCNPVIEPTPTPTATTTPSPTTTPTLAPTPTPTHTPTPAPPLLVTRLEVGEEEEVVLDGNGYTMTIAVPAGAVVKSITVTIKGCELPAPPPVGQAPVLDCFDMNAADETGAKSLLIFSTPVTVSVAVDSSLLQAAAAMSEIQLVSFDAASGGWVDGTCREPTAGGTIPPAATTEASFQVCTLSLFTFFTQDTREFVFLPSVSLP